MPESIQELFNVSCHSTSLKLERRIITVAVRAWRLGRAPPFFFVLSIYVLVVCLPQKRENLFHRHISHYVENVATLNKNSQNLEQS